MTVCAVPRSPSATPDADPDETPRPRRQLSAGSSDSAGLVRSSSTMRSMVETAQTPEEAAGPAPQATSADVQKAQTSALIDQRVSKSHLGPQIKQVVRRGPALRRRPIITNSRRSDASSRSDFEGPQRQTATPSSPPARPPTRRHQTARETVAPGRSAPVADHRSTGDQRWGWAVDGGTGGGRVDVAVRIVLMFWPCRLIQSNSGGRACGAWRGTS